MEGISISKWCRICFSEFSSGIFLFGDEAKKLFLEAKIKKYLALSISIGDKLSKMICQECCKQLDVFHRFATMAQNNQEKMDKLINSNHKLKDEKTENDNSLLHSYLTRGIKEKSSDFEVTEVEVRIDPMVILEYGQESEDQDHEIDDIKDESSDSDNYINTQKDWGSDENNFECTGCPSKFDSETDSQRLSEKDDEDKIDKFTCPVCGKVISTKGNLKVHLATHRPKGKYECDICGRIFKTQCNLHRHKSYHGGIQYPCGVCGRVYSTNSTLRAHSITHSDLRPHKCPLCDKTFKRNQDLKFHINQHTGARPYQCPYCPKAFASSGNCFSHRKRMHPIEVERDREKAAKIIR